MEPITIENAAEWLKDIIKMQEQGPISIDVIQDVVSSYFGFEVEDLKSPQKDRRSCLCKTSGHVFIQELTDLSLQQIGVAFNKKDHTTVLHACRKIEEIMKDDLKMRKIVDNLVDNLKISRE